MGCLNRIFALAASLTMACSSVSLTPEEREECLTDDLDLKCAFCPKCSLDSEGRIADRCDRRELPCVVVHKDESGEESCTVLESPGALYFISPRRLSHWDSACPERHTDDDDSE
jgi:hypothetical protein